MYQQYINQALGSVSSLNSEQLKDLLNDDGKLEEMINIALAQLESEKDIILGENRSIAENNLKKEPILIEMRSKINDLQEEGKLLCASVQEKSDAVKGKSGNLNQDTALALLQTAAAESEEESERIFKQFLDSDIAMDIFLEQFLASRKLMHNRKLKADKMVELLKQPNINGRTSGAPYSMPHSGFYPPSSGTGIMPYPVGPISMPMPGMFRPAF